MRGASGDDVIYRREECKGVPAIWKAPGAEDEVDSLLNNLQSDFGGYYLEVQKIERMQKEVQKNAFELKKKMLEERSEQSLHWKCEELDSVKREMRNILLGEEKVLEKTVYVGVDDKKTVKGIFETGFASTMCGKGWFANGNYVTTKPWYAARYGLEGCYGGNDGILDPRSEVAVGKNGRLLVCRAVMSNVYPITRECEEDHAIKDFADAAKQVKPESKWYDSPMKRGYDAHFVRVKKMDVDTYSNFQACQEKDALNKSDMEIADEIVIREEAQLLPEYIVIFKVSKTDPNGILMHIKLPQLEMECWSSGCSDNSSSTGISKSSTVKALDSPRKVSALLVFTESTDQDQRYIYSKRDLLRRNGFADASVVVIKDPLEMRKAVDYRQPSIVYIEGPPSQEWPLRRFRKDVHLIEELVLMLGPAGSEWSQWRGCVLNFGAAEQDIVDKVCDSHAGKLYFLTWVKHPCKSDMDDLWQILFEIALHHPGEESFDMISNSMMPDMLVKEAFEKAAWETARMMPDKLVNTVVKQQQEQPVHSQKQAAFEKVSSVASCTMPNKLMNEAVKQKQERPVGNQEEEALKDASSVIACMMPDKVVNAALKQQQEQPVSNHKERKRLGFKSAIKGCKVALKKVRRAMASSGVQVTSATVEAKVITDPDVDLKSKNISSDDAKEFEERNIVAFPEEVRGGGLGFTGPGSIHLRMDIKAFDWLCNRIEGSHEPLYFDLPMAWGGGKVRVQKVLPGDTCWFEAVARADDVHAICNNLREELTKGDDHEKKETSLPGSDEEHRATPPGESGALEGFWCDSSGRSFKFTAMGSLYYFEMITNRSFSKVRGMLAWRDGWYHGALMDREHKSGYKVDKYIHLRLHQDKIMMTLQETKLFGSNEYGQTSLPDLGGKKVVSAAAGGWHTVLVLEDGTAKIFGDNRCGQTSLPDLGGKKVVSAAAGCNHTVLRLEDGTAKKFGGNDYGGGKFGGRHEVRVLKDGTAKMFGDNRCGQTSLPDLGGKKVASAAAGGWHTVLVLEDGTAKMFGCNDDGQTSLPDLGGKKVASAAAGGDHTVLVLEEEDINAHPQKAEISVPTGPWIAGSVFEVRIHELPSDDDMLKARIAKAFTGDLVEALTVSKHAPIHDLRDAIMKRAQESSKEAVKQVKVISKGRDITGELDKHLQFSHGDQLTLHLSGYPYFCDGVGFEVELSKYGADEFEKYAMEYVATPSLYLAETAYLWAEIIVKNFWYLQFPQPIGAGLSIGERAVVEEQLQERWAAEILDKWKAILIFEKQKVSKETYAECASTPKDEMQVNDACKKVLLQTMKQQGHEQADLLPYKGALARCWWEMGRFEEAEDIFRQNIEVQTEKLGHSHLGTVASKNTLAAFLTTERRYAEVMGKHHEAKSLLRQSLETLEKELGPHHPSTLDCEERLHRSTGKGKMKGEGKGKGK